MRHKYAVFPGASRIYYKLLKENETIIAETYCQRVGVLTQTRARRMLSRAFVNETKKIYSLLSPSFENINSLEKGGKENCNEDWNRFSSGGI